MCGRMDLSFVLLGVESKEQYACRCVDFMRQEALQTNLWPTKNRLQRPTMLSIVLAGTQETQREVVGQQCNHYKSSSKNHRNFL